MVIDITTRAELEAIRDETAPDKFLLLFTQPSACAPCRAFEPHFEAAAVAKPEVKFVRINLDNLKDFSLLRDFGVMGVPALFIVSNIITERLDARTAVALSKALD